MAISSLWVGWLVAAVAVVAVAVPLWFQARKHWRMRALFGHPEPRPMPPQEWAARYYADPRMREIAAQFVVLLGEQVDVPLNQLTPRTRFLEDLEMVDLEPLELLLAIEQEFGSGRISEAAAARLQAIDDVVRYLAQVR